MAVRHLRDYYNQVSGQMSSLQSTIETFVKESADTMVSPKIMENLKKQLAVIQDNKKRLDYIMYLLDIPNRKKKESNFQKMAARRLKSIHQQQEIVENNQAIKKINAQINKISKEASK